MSQKALIDYSYEQGTPGTICDTNSSNIEVDKMYTLEEAINSRLSDPDFAANKLNIAGAPIEKNVVIRGYDTL